MCVSAWQSAIRTRTIARPLKIIKHRSRDQNAAAIAQEASSQGADLILVGLALDQDGQVGHQARKALRLVDALRKTTTIQVAVWDESGSTQQALDLGGLAAESG